MARSIERFGERATPLVIVKERYLLAMDWNAARDRDHSIMRRATMASPGTALARSSAVRSHRHQHLRPADPLVWVDVSRGVRRVRRARAPAHPARIGQGARGGRCRRLADVRRDRSDPRRAAGGCPFLEVRALPSAYGPKPADLDRRHELSRRISRRGPPGGGGMVAGEGGVGRGGWFSGAPV